MVKHFSLFILLGLVLGFSLTSCSSEKTIVNNIQERDANEILVLLASHDINATKVESPSATGGPESKIQLWDIQVPTNKALDATSILNQAGLPRMHSENLLQIFGQSGLVPSDVQEKIRYQAGLAQEIANTIRKFDGVLDAKVTLSIPTPNPLNPEQKGPPPTASVYVKHNGILDNPNAHLVSKIKRFVAAAVPGLTYDNVTVIGEKAAMPELPTSAAAPQEEPLVYVWSVELAKNSVDTFRMILFSQLILNIVLIIVLCLVFWKMLPLVHEHGLKHLLSLKPFPEAKAVSKEAPKAKPSGKQPEEPSDRREREDI